MVAFRFDASQYEPSMGGAQVQPEGWYNAVVSKTEIVKTKDETKNNHFLALTFQLSNGSTFVERYNIINDNADAVRIALQALSYLRGVLRLAPQMNDTQELHNIPLQIFLSVEESEVSGRKVSQNRMRNARFADGTDYKPGKVPPPNPATQNPSQAGHYTPPQPGQQPQGQGHMPGNFAPPPNPGQPQGGGFPQPGQPPMQPQGGFAPPPPPPPQGGFPQPGQPAQGFQPPANGGGFPQPGQAPGQQPQGGGFPQAGGFPQPGQPMQPQQGGFQAPGFPQPGFPQQ